MNASATLDSADVPHAAARSRARLRNPALRAHALRALGAAAAVAALYCAFRDVKPGALLALLEGVRWALPLVLLPSAVAMSLECLGWQRAFRLLGAAPPVLSLLTVRIASESVGSILPLGAVWSETAKPPLLSRHARIPLATSVASILARKYLLLTAHGVYLAAGFIAGNAVLSRGLQQIAGASWLAAVPLLAALFVFGSAQLMLVGFRGGRVLECAVSALGRIPLSGVRRAVRALASGARRSDEEASRFFRAPPREIAKAVLPCLAGWLLEACETWLLLRLLGVHLDFAGVLGVEVLVNLGRQVLVMLPGGLGAQELGYAAFLATLGVPVETSAAFALLKRGKEAFWIVTGLAVLLRPARHAFATVPTT